MKIKKIILILLGVIVLSFLSMLSYKYYDLSSRGFSPFDLGKSFEKNELLDRLKTDYPNIPVRHIKEEYFLEKHNSGFPHNVLYVKDRGLLKTSGCFQDYPKVFEKMIALNAKLNPESQVIQNYTAIKDEFNKSEDFHLSSQPNFESKNILFIYFTEYLGELNSKGVLGAIEMYEENPDYEIILVNVDKLEEWGLE